MPARAPRPATKTMAEPAARAPAPRNSRSCLLAKVPGRAPEPRAKWVLQRAEDLPRSTPRRLSTAAASWAGLRSCRAEAPARRAYRLAPALPAEFPPARLPQPCCARFALRERAASMAGNTVFPRAPFPEPAPAAASTVMPAPSPAPPPAAGTASTLPVAGFLEWSPEPRHAERTMPSGSRGRRNPFGAAAQTGAPSAPPPQRAPAALPGSQRALVPTRPFLPLLPRLLWTHFPPPVSAAWCVPVPAPTEPACAALPAR